MRTPTTLWKATKRKLPVRTRTRTTVWTSHVRQLEDLRSTRPWARNKSSGSTKTAVQTSGSMSVAGGSTIPSFTVKLSRIRFLPLTPRTVLCFEGLFLDSKSNLYLPLTMQNNITVTSWSNNAIWPVPEASTDPAKVRYFTTLVKLNKDLFPTVFWSGSWQDAFFFEVCGDREKPVDMT